MKASRHSLQVIVADDHDIIRRELVRIVSETLPTAVVIAVPDGLRALQAIERSGADLLVSDHRMPGMEGTTLTRHLRKKGASLPIILVSLDAGVGQDALAAGASEFLMKEEVLERLPELLRHYAASAGRAAA